MTDDSSKGVLRLQRRHEPDPEGLPDIDVGRRLLAVQSVRNALVAGCVVIILFSLLWMLLSSALDKIYPWLALLLGMGIGLAVRRAGLGLDWRFPLIAALLAVVGSFSGYLVVAASFTAESLGTSTIGVLSGMTSLTWPRFFAQAITPADMIYAGIAAAIAAFFSMRKLTRRQYLALRLYRQSLSP